MTGLQGVGVGTDTGGDVMSCNPGLGSGSEPATVSAG